LTLYGSFKINDSKGEYAIYSEAVYNFKFMNFQSVQFKLADMAVAIELARNQYLKAAWLKDKG
jgi:hypothetical protein